MSSQSLLPSPISVNYSYHTFHQVMSLAVGQNLVAGFYQTCRFYKSSLVFEVRNWILEFCCKSCQMTDMQSGKLLLGENTLAFYVFSISCGGSVFTYWGSSIQSCAFTDGALEYHTVGAISFSWHSISSASYANSAHFLLQPITLSRPIPLPLPAFFYTWALLLALLYLPYGLCYWPFLLHGPCYQLTLIYYLCFRLFFVNESCYKPLFILYIGLYFSKGRFRLTNFSPPTDRRLYPDQMLYSS